MLGLAPPEPAAADGGDRPRTASESLPSDFPAALGSLDESDLPVVSPDLPVAARSGPAPAVGSAARAPEASLAARPWTAAPGPPASATPSPFDDSAVDLPAIASDLPAAKPKPPVAKRAPPPPPGRAAMRDLPELRGADLPARAVGLPVVAAHLPARAASLPAITSALPVAAAALPAHVGSVPASPDNASRAREFGDLDFSSAPESVTAAALLARDRAAVATPPDLGAFGEIDLPREEPLGRRSPIPAASVGPRSAEFGDLELEDGPRRSGPPAALAGRSDGGMRFGEVDFESSPHSAAHDERRAIGLDGPPSGPSPAPQVPELGPTSWAPPPASATAAAVPPLPRSADVPGDREVKKKRGWPAKGVTLVLLVLLTMGGAALQLSPYGAFGYLVILDLVRSGAYARATSGAVRDAQHQLGVDTYDAATGAVDGAYAAHTRTPRARPLTAYAAFVDLATAVRFGQDTARVSRAAQMLGDLPQDQNVKYRDVALAAQAATNGDIDGARRIVEAALRRDGSDPIRLDEEVLEGELALLALDARAALRAFNQALAWSNDARSHFGLARAYDTLGDAAHASIEIEATLAASPRHPGALILRARRKSASVDPRQALADLAIVLEGSARAKASPGELSSGYAARAWVELDRGAASDARDAFAQAVKFDPQNVDALNGQGRLFLNEGRYAEALARFDTATKLAPSSPTTIANDAEAKIALERLEDAKQQLVLARAKFPKNPAILLVLAAVEQHLGNVDAADAALREAIADVDPTRAEAVRPFVALSELQSSRGRLADARATLDDARKKLPASPALDLAFGEVNELQGDYDGAIGHYKSAVAKDDMNVPAHFRLAVALRRVRRFEEARLELDRVAAVDRDYPGLQLERGLLFEDAGDVEKAIEQFKSALAQAPDDPDLQLRVGSAYVAIGRPDDALPMLRKVLDKRPTSAEANHYLGRALMQQGGPVEADALRYLKRAAELDPNRAEFHVYLARAANDAMPAQLELARDEIERALALDKLSADAYWQRGVLERMEGAIDDAVKDEKHALELRPTRYEAYAALAECYEDKNESAAALTEWPRAIAGDANATAPDGSVLHPYWRYRFGKLILEKGNAAIALTHLLPASQAAEKMAIRPAWLSPLEFLTAEALRSTGHKADAVDHYRRFLEIAPVNSPDRYDAQKALAALTAAR
ncbi:MAG: tetratricopeptide repeat protein [Polyangiaceae bacterium]